MLYYMDFGEETKFSLKFLKTINLILHFMILILAMQNNSVIKEDMMSGVMIICPFITKKALPQLKESALIEDYDTRSVEGLEFLGYEGPYTMVDFYVHREDVQIGTEEEEALRYDPSLDYPEENWGYPDENHHQHPDSEVAQLGEEEVYSCIPYDQYYYNDDLEWKRIGGNLQQEWIMGRALRQATTTSF